MKQGKKEEFLLTRENGFSELCRIVCRPFFPMAFPLWSYSFFGHCLIFLKNRYRTVGWHRERFHASLPAWLKRVDLLWRRLETSFENVWKQAGQLVRYTTDKEASLEFHLSRRLPPLFEKYKTQQCHCKISMSLGRCLSVYESLWPMNPPLANEIGPIWTGPGKKRNTVYQINLVGFLLSTTFWHLSLCLFSSTVKAIKNSKRPKRHHQQEK